MDRRNSKFYLRPRQGVRAPRLSPTYLLDSSPKGDHREITAFCGESWAPPCHVHHLLSLLLLPLAVSESTGEEQACLARFWGAGPPSSAPPRELCPEQTQAQASSSGHPCVFWEDLALLTAGMNNPQQQS